MKNGKHLRQQISTDKSTDPLVLSLNSNGIRDMESASGIVIFGGGSGVVTPLPPLSPVNLDMLPPPPTHHPAPAIIGSDGDETSEIGGVTPRSTTTPRAPAMRPGAVQSRSSQAFKQFGVNSNGKF